MCAGNFAQRTRIFLIDKRKKKKNAPRQARDAFLSYSSDATHAAPFLFHRLLTRVVRDLHLYRRNFPHSRTYGVQTALAPPLATGCELLSASRGSRGGVTGHPHPLFRSPHHPLIYSTVVSRHKVFASIYHRSLWRLRSELVHHIGRLPAIIVASPF